jgi:hypothetical protein
MAPTPKEPDRTSEKPKEVVEYTFPGSDSPEMGGSTGIESGDAEETDEDSPE